MIARVLIYLLLFTTLTIITQIGGIVLLLTLFFYPAINRKWLKKRIRFAIKSGVFILLYLATCLWIVPWLAPAFGRKALPKSGLLAPRSHITWLLNRHYVNHTLFDVLESTAIKMNSTYPETQLLYLDANFPFFDGFPLLPHLSHDDGKKVDLAFFYKDKSTHMQTNTSPSFLGYGAYVAPLNGELDQPELCKKQGYWQYDLADYLTLGMIDNSLAVDNQRTKTLLTILAQNSKISKIFIEPHLVSRWRLRRYPKIRYHGCHAVRHDDHIHLQI
ncbi:MAG: hypothetical protein AAFX87_06520 [Bacteroidota bacterium]